MGSGSAVRRAGAFGARPVVGSHRVFRAVVEGSFNATGAEYWTALGLFGASPVGQGCTYLYGTAEAPAVRAAIDGGDLAALADAWATALPEVEPMLRAIPHADALLVNEVGTVRCRTFVDRQAVLIGDAAHAMAPNLGQGANSAFVDAAVLASEVVRAPDLAAGLARYDRRRRRKVRAVQRNAGLLATVSHGRHPLLRAVRDGAFRLAGRPALIRSQIRATQQVDPAELAREVRALVG